MKKNWKPFIVRHTVYIAFLISFFCCQSKESESIELSTIGVVVKVNDLDIARNFYEKILGFSVLKISEEKIELKTDSKLQFWLEKVKYNRNVKYQEETQCILTLQTNNLDGAMVTYKSKGLNFIRDKAENGVGFSAPFRDPFGNVISLLEQSKFTTSYFSEPKIYNLGVYLPDIEKSKSFYIDLLGLEIRTENYLPEVLPLNHNDSTLAIILHNSGVVKTDVRYQEFAQTNIVFGISSLLTAQKRLNQNNIEWIEVEPNLSMAVRDPWGNYLKFQQLE